MQSSAFNNNKPDGADFSLDILSDEMEPTIPVGSTVFIRRGSTAAAGDIVLIMHNGAVLCRRMVDDPFGNIYFVCDNPDRAEDSIMVRRDDIQNTVCFGTVSGIQSPGEGKK